MYLVMTTVQLQPDSIDAVRDLFVRTNPDLVKGETDWMEAKFTANRADNRVTVLAFWRDAEAYRAFSGSERFKTVMSQFAPYFAGPPEISIHEVLFEM